MLHLGGDLLFQMSGGHAGQAGQRLVAVGGGIFARLLVRGLRHRTGHGIGGLRLAWQLLAAFTFVEDAGAEAAPPGMEKAASTLATTNTTG